MPIKITMVPVCNNCKLYLHNCFCSQQVIANSAFENLSHGTEVGRHHTGRHQKTLRPWEDEKLKKKVISITETSRQK